MVGAVVEHRRLLALAFALVGFDLMLPLSGEPGLGEGFHEAPPAPQRHCLSGAIFTIHILYIHSHYIGVVVVHNCYVPTYAFTSGTPIY
jgi:hypothetical protein